MKQLQNNFTTPEQSKRLLASGVPPWSADCYLLYNKVTNEYDNVIVINDQDDFNFIDENSIPCWSVGRLIEIYIYLASYEYVSLIFKKTFTPMDKILDKIEKGIANGMLDFSKLEE